jgi:hypothetical protein
LQSLLFQYFLLALANGLFFEFALLLCCRLLFLSILLLSQTFAFDLSLVPVAPDDP